MDYIMMFLNGIASFISPCMLPMVPLYVTYFIGEEKQEKNKAIWNSIAFVLGFSVVFIVLAVFASTVGRVLSHYMEIIQIVFGIFIVILGLHYMDVIQLKFLNYSKGFQMKTQKIGIVKAFAFGTLFSITWTPCIGVFLSSALILVATEGQVLKGVVLLAIYSLGLGIPFILSAVLIEKLKGAFGWIKKHFNQIKYISGILLIILGIYTIIK